jgi:hypothetical protein
MNIIYIVVSILSIGLYVASVQFKEKKEILVIQAGASLCYLIVYIIKGAMSGAIIEIIEGIKDLLFARIESKNKKIPLLLLLLFLSLLIITSIIFYNGFLSLLPLFINIILFVSTYFKNPKYIRWIMLLCGILWGLYNIYVGAYIIVIGNILEIISAIISIIRFKELDKN